MLSVTYGLEIPFILQITAIWSVTIISIVVYESTGAIQSKSDERLMFIGDFSILLVSYCFFTFNILDVETNFIIGYVPIAMTGLYILCCLGVIVLVSSVILKRRIRRYFAISKYTSKREKTKHEMKSERKASIQRHCEKRK